MASIAPEKDPLGSRGSPDAGPSDEELVERCRSELPYVTTAFEVLVRRYEPVVFRTCWQWLRDQEEAEEASQDAFLRSLHGLPKFEGRSSFRTWVLRIVSNVCATRRRRMIERRNRDAAYAATVGDPSALTLTTGRNPDGVCGAIGDFGGGETPVSEALTHLSDDDREVLTLRFVSDLHLEEIAEMQGLSLSAAKMRLYRAIGRFKNAYEKESR